MTFFDTLERQEAVWSSLADRHIGPDARFLSGSASSAFRRVYASGDRIFKVVRRHENGYRNTLREEYELLKSLNGLDFVPTPLDFQEHSDASILVLKRIDGEVIGQAGDATSLRVAPHRVAGAFLRLNRHGVRHGDAHFDNLIVRPDGSVAIVDFDQAAAASSLGAFVGDFFGMGSTPAVKTVGRLLVRLVYSRLPRAVRERARIGSRVRARRLSAAPSPNGPSDLAAQVREVWTAAAVAGGSSPHDPVAYYRLVFEDEVLPGERAWEPRWQSIARAVDFSGLRLVELGCNLGLLSCFAQRAGARAPGLGVDHSEAILDCARDFARLTDSCVDFRRIDFDRDPAWEQSIPSGDFDIVSALSVLQWLQNKERFLAFLSRFPRLIFEGHDPLQVEVGRLQAHGFNVIRVVGVSERGRPVLYAER